MNHAQNSLQLNLDVQSVFAIAQAAGTDIRCTAGMVWITEEGGTGDHVLKPGQNYRIQGPGKVLIEGLQPASVSTLYTPCAWKLSAHQGLAADAAALLVAIMQRLLQGAVSHPKTGPAASQA